MKQLQLTIKRIFDFSIAACLLALLSPILSVFALLILFLDGCPVFFNQLRPGKNRKIFKLYKFRTMKTEEQGKDAPDYVRTTKFGAFLRRSSIDELPQLFNVILGNLSLVGPRPLLIEYLPLYSSRQNKRHDVKPGITGWAQINGRNSLTWNQKFEYDIWYVENWSLWLDIKIIFVTIFKVLKQSEVNASNKITMEKFKGPNK